jgi:uncharacterized protein (TIGR02266 family)
MRGVYLTMRPDPPWKTEMAEASSTEDVITLRIRFKSETFEKFAERYAADLTRDEIFIRAREPLPVGSILALDFTLNDGTPLIRGRGTVEWTRDSELFPGAPPGMGIRFGTLSDDSRQMLGRILEAKDRLASNTSWTAPPAAAPERREPPRALRPAAANVPGARVMTPPRGSAPPGAVSPANVTPAKVSGASPKQPAVPASPPANQPSPERAIPNVFPDEDNGEPTELARLPPAFFYEEVEEEKTKLQDPRMAAALLQRNLTEDEDDDITNVRANASLYSGAAVSSPATADTRTGRPERRTPFPAHPPPPIDTPAWSPKIQESIHGPSHESPFRPSAPPAPAHTESDHNPAAISAATEVISADPELVWPSSSSPAPAPVSPSPSQSKSAPQSNLDRELLAGLEPDAGPNELRWGAGDKRDKLDRYETATAPNLPAVSSFPRDAAMMAPPPWQAPPVDSRARLPVEQSFDEDARKTRLAFLKTWPFLTVAAGGILVAALLLLPALLRPGAGERTATPPEATPGAPPTSAPPATSPPARDPAPPAGTTGVIPPAAPGSSTAPGSPPESGRAPPSPTAPGPAEALKPTDPAPAAKPARPTAAELRPPFRPSRPRGARRSAAAAEARERTSAAEADPAPPPSAPAGIQADGAQEVYWLTVRSVPAGADVLIDGQLEGTTPFVRRIFDPTRNYAITVRRAGFEPYERTLSASDEWSKRGTVRTLTVVAKLNPASNPSLNPSPGTPEETRSPGLPPPPTQEPGGAARPEPPPPPFTPPAVEHDRKINPFAEPGAPGGSQPK